MEIRIALQPKQSEFLEAIEKYKVTFYGGAKGGGKSHALRNIMLYRRFKYPGTTGAIFRRTYPELEGNVIRPLFRAYPELRKYYNKNEHLLTLPNRSTLEFHYCAREQHLDNHQGIEYHDIGIEEAGQWPEEWFQRLRGSNRSSIPGVKPRMILTGNPGGIGHKWLKRLFIDRDYNERERPEDYHFILALVFDNPALLDNDPDYLANLKAEPNEALRRAYLEGDWDIFAGQYFSEWRRNVHVLPADFSPQPWWNRFGAYDHGFAHPAVFGAFAVDDDGNVYLYREWAANRHRPDQIAAGIYNTLGADEFNKLRSTIYAGGDCFSTRDGGPTVAEKFSRLPDHLKMTMLRAKLDRVQGAQQVRNYLAWQNLPSWKEERDGKIETVSMTGPRFFVHPSCVRTIDCLPRMIHDDKKPEDVLKVDATDADPWAGDDPYDMVRYGLMSRPQISFKPKKPAEYASAAWFKQRMSEEKKKMEKKLKVRMRRHY